MATPHPISIGTGNKHLHEALWSSENGLSVSVHYNYNDDLPTIFGRRWRGAYSRQLMKDDDGSRIAIRDDGRTLRFIAQSTNWKSDADVVDQLIELHDSANATIGWQYHVDADNSVETYDTAGKLQTIQFRSGKTLSLQYGDGTATGPLGDTYLTADAAPTTYPLAIARLLRTTDEQGNSIRYRYNMNDQVAQVIDSAGQSYAFKYDSNINLTRITYPDGQTKTYHYNEPANTGGANLPNALTGITDENGIRYVSYSYDSTGRAVSEVFPAVGTNTNRYQLSFGTDSTTVTDPLNTVRTYSFQTILGVVKPTGSSQPGGSGCGPAASALTYDASGNVATRTDFNGNQTTYTYDLTRNLETKRIEASGKPESRTISTTWHSDWRLPTKVAEPKKLTTWIYNGDGGVLCAPASATVPDLTGAPRPIGVLCKTTEQPTTDLNGSAGLTAPLTGLPRTWTYTYNSLGQVLTADGPRSDVSDVTTTTYHAPTDPDLGKRGQLATLTNALGHTTQITAYDLNGNPLTVIDANGAVTTLTYDLRQRLTSRQIGSELTTYQYDGVGQLTKITLPDGRYLSYSYDPAHRLTD
ncbi:DUF6531 domain-containing protein, partial [Propionivibrio sp.]|uniref:DUF6531 domain-containing protein n=1 Tax=Propionivibrio sp. TaxID=2212460 RepID=UPI00262F33B0